MHRGDNQTEIMDFYSGKSKTLSIKRFRRCNMQSADDARMHADAMIREILDGHPGWDFSAFLEGWLDPKPVEGDSDGWMDSPIM